METTRIARFVNHAHQVITAQKAQVMVTRTCAEWALIVLRAQQLRHHVQRVPLAPEYWQLARVTAQHVQLTPTVTLASPLPVNHVAQPPVAVLDHLHALALANIGTSRRHRRHVSVKEDIYTMMRQTH